MRLMMGNSHLPIPRSYSSTAFRCCSAPCQLRCPSPPMQIMGTGRMQLLTGTHGVLCRIRPAAGELGLCRPAVQPAGLPYRQRRGGGGAGLCMPHACMHACMPSSISVILIVGLARPPKSTDVPSQMQCLEPLLAWLAEQNASAESPLHGRVALDRLGVAGHSRGAKLAALHFAGARRSAPFSTCTP